MPEIQCFLCIRARPRWVLSHPSSERPAALTSPLHVRELEGREKASCSLCDALDDGSDFVDGVFHGVGEDDVVGEKEEKSARRRDVASPDPHRPAVSRISDAKLSFPRVCVSD